MSKPDCYKCKHRGGVPGSAHSSCQHPSFGPIKGDPLLGMMAMFSSVGRVPPMQAPPTDGITVKGSDHGRRMGWFNHPWDFDPVWLEECNGFEEKGENHG